MDKGTKGLSAAAAKFSFLLPALIFFGFAVIFPFFRGFDVAFTNWDGISRESQFIGLDNFARIITNRDVLRPLGISLHYALLNTIGVNLFALTFALFVVRKHVGHKMHRLLFFMPTALNSVLVIFIWRYIYSFILPELFGVRNYLAGLDSVITAATAITIWGGSGVAMMIYIAALTGVPTELYESAKIDGAGALRRFFNITIPMIMPAFTVNITLTLTISLSSTGLFLAATGGGPAGASESMGLYIYKHLFVFARAGYGQALAYAFLVVVLAIGLTLTALFRKREVEL